MDVSILDTSTSVQLKVCSFLFHALDFKTRYLDYFETLSQKANKKGETPLLPLQVPLCCWLVGQSWLHHSPAPIILHSHGLPLSLATSLVALAISLASLLAFNPGCLEFSCTCIDSFDDLLDLSHINDGVGMRIIDIALVLAPPSTPPLAIHAISITSSTMCPRCFCIVITS